MKKIKEIIINFEKLIIQYQLNSPEQFIKGISKNSMDIKKNDIFIAIKGETFDSHQCIKEVLTKNIKHIVIEDEKYYEKYKNEKINLFLVRNSRHFYNKLSEFYYDNNYKNFCHIAITGTNGKSTTAYIIFQYLNLLYKNAFYVGSLGVFTNESKIKSTLTTPDSYFLNHLFDSLKDKNLKYHIIESSSHALKQDRLGSIRFKYAIFTNLSQDHLDYHKSLEDYYQTKKNFLPTI